MTYILNTQSFTVEEVTILINELYINYYLYKDVYIYTYNIYINYCKL